MERRDGLKHNVDDVIVERISNILAQSARPIVPK